MQVMQFDHVAAIEHLIAMLGANVLLALAPIFSPFGTGKPHWQSYLVFATGWRRRIMVGKNGGKVVPPDGARPGFKKCPDLVWSLLLPGMDMILRSSPGPWCRRQRSENRTGRVTWPR